MNRLAPLRLIARISTASSAAPESSAANTTHWFYFNRLFPPTGVLGKFFTASIFVPQESSVRSNIEKHLKNARILGIDVRSAEGGAFVKLAGDLDEIRSAASVGFDSKYFFTRHRTRGFEVEGKPWITDIPRSPTRLLKVSPEIPDEDCYDLLRPYGRIMSVKNGVVRFISLQDATTAAFCSHRQVISDPITGKDITIRLKPVEQPFVLARAKTWAGSHPRVVIPISIAILFALAYMIFEPVREICIGWKIRGTFASVEKYVEWAYENSQRLIGVGSGKDATQLTSSWNKTARDSETLRGYIDEGAPTFIVVSGPKGSGKRAILDNAIAVSRPNSRSDHPDVLSIDCNKFTSPNDDVNFANLASTLGYWPVFLWANRMMRAVELGIHGMTGQDANLTETPDQLVQRILDTTSRAIRRVALRSMPSTGVSETAYLEAHPNELPIIVLTGYPTNSRIVDLLTEWAGTLVKNQIARVVFVTKESAFDKRFSAVLPNKIFRVVQVEDASPQAAKEYVMQQFTNQVESSAAAAAYSEFEQLPADFLEPLGGRYTDLQSFGRRLLNGDSPQQALSELVHSTALEASQLFLSEGHKWTVEQAWTLVKCLANASGDDFLSVPGKIAVLPAFDGSDTEESLEALEQSGLVVLRSTGGRITGVKPSKPLYRAAFAEISGDPLVSAYMAKRLAKFKISKELRKVAQYEEELVKLAQALGANSVKEAKERQEYVAKQLGASQAKIQGYEAELAQSSAELANFEWFSAKNPRKSNTGGIWSKKEASSRFQ